MFPVSFAESVVREYTRKGQLVLDPFAGRGTALFAAASQGRFGLGAEINPVGWVYGKAKMHTAERADVEELVRRVGKMSARYRDEAAALPMFFRHCFSQPVREFLVAARHLLNWRHRKADCTTMALLLVDLHGKRESALSNQMRQTKAMSPEYAIRWWREREMHPPERNPVEFMHRKIAWRYKRGRPDIDGSRIYLGDSQVLLKRMQEDRTARPKHAKLLLTSPPYHGISNYFYDQWLRLWLLGGPPFPKSLGEKCKRKFQSKHDYEELLRSVFERSKPLLSRKAVIYVRTDARKFTLDATQRTLEQVFRSKKLREAQHSVPDFTQTTLFNAQAKSKGDVDFIMW